MDKIKIKILNMILKITAGNSNSTLGRSPLVRELEFILLFRKVSINCCIYCPGGTMLMDL